MIYGEVVQKWRLAKGATLHKWPHAKGAAFCLNLAVMHEEEELYKLRPANKTDQLCHSWQ